MLMQLLLSKIFFNHKIFIFQYFLQPKKLEKFLHFLLKVKLRWVVKTCQQLVSQITAQKRKINTELCPELEIISDEKIFRQLPLGVLRVVCCQPLVTISYDSYDAGACAGADVQSVSDTRRENMWNLTQLHSCETIPAQASGAHTSCEKYLKVEEKIFLWAM